MIQNIILAGVGGQGILTMAQAISRAAMRRGLYVKQAEVHGMSQRGGEVYAHVRISSEPIFSDLIPMGQCDLVISLEPLESLRYVGFLRGSGRIVSNTTPVTNIADYPDLATLYDRITSCADSVLIDADRLARAAGSTLASNSAMLGAASIAMDLRAEELEEGLVETLASKGIRVVEANRRAFQLGRAAAELYLELRSRGLTPEAVRRCLTELSAEQILSGDLSGLPEDASPPALSPQQRNEVGRILKAALAAGRTQLFEQEVYALLEIAGAIVPPKHLFVPAGRSVTEAELAQFAADQIVLKVVSPRLVHKFQAGGVRFVPKNIEMVNEQIGELTEVHRLSPDSDGILLVEFVEHGGTGLGQELFVGIRHSRAFGAVIAAGLGGVETEYLARSMKPGTAIARAIVADTSPRSFLELFKSTAAYDALSGRMPGHHRVVSDAELLRCFRAFMAIAAEFCVPLHPSQSIVELEINPFAFARHRLIPLDGRAALGTIAKPAPLRPLQKMPALLEPRSIALVGVSAKRKNFGRIILENIRECGFPMEHLYLIKPGVREIDGIPCFDSLAALPESIDLLVIAASKDLAALVGEAIDCKKVQSIILIPGGVGETAGTQELQNRLRALIQASRARPDGGVVVLGGNCLGARSRPGRYDTFFVPGNKLNSRRDEPATCTALITQSGGFAISRLSNLEGVNPVFAITVGNQVDLTVSDCLRAVAARDDIKVLGLYVEGFSEGDGAAFVRQVRKVTSAGKQVVFYKAGRTQLGRSATAGHTASLAGDYDVCQSVAAQAGAIVVDTFKEFEQVLDLGTAFHDLHVSNRRVGIVTNAGFEAVGMADAAIGTRYALEIPPLSESTRERINKILTATKLERLVNVRNPLDVTPMADEYVYRECIRTLLEEQCIDAVVVSVLPFTAKLKTTEPEITSGDGRSLVDELPDLLKRYRKPIIAAIDAGRMYDFFARMLRQRGIPVFRSCDQAIQSLGRFLCHRAGQFQIAQPLQETARESAEVGELVAVNGQP